MNKVFKIVWSKSKQCYVVVSEYAKSNGGKKKVLATVLAGLMMAGVAGGLAPQQALAGDDYSNSAINIEPDGLYPAYRNKGVNKNAIAIGGQNNVTGTPGNGRIALGFGNTASKDSSVAIGSSNEAVGGGSTAIGVDAHAGEAVQNGVTIGGSVALGNSVWAVNAAAVAIGTHVNASGTAAGAYSTAMGSKTDATGFESVAIGTLDKATGTQAVVVGAENEATATNATAIGSKNTATQQAATALGTWTNATGLRSTAVGVNAAASGQSSQAMGDHAEATGFGATAVGKAAKAKAQSAGAFGDTANATGVQSLAAGYSTTATSEDSNAIGSRTSSTGKYATAVGTEANASGESGFAAGAKINATGNQSTAVGYHSTASGAGSVTLGRDATASATAAYAMGYGASSTNTSAFAIGSRANAGAYNSMAIGKGATTKAQDATSTYSYSGTGGAVGASGYNTETSTIHSGDGTNTATDTYNAGDTLAIGTNATVSEQSNETVAIGKDSSAEKNTHYSTVIGQGAQARQGASDSTVIGHGAYTEARESVAIGRTANISGTDSVRSTAMGWGARVSNAYDATAIGTGAQTTVTGGVAIGSGADSSRATTDPKSSAYDAARANGTAIHNRKYNPTVFATGATQGAVSVGNDIEKRQIINVAGGSDDYDAVNVAQLKNVGVIVKGNTGKSDFLVHDGSLKVEGTGRISTVAADDGTKDSKITLSFDDSGLANTSLTNITNDGKKTITGLGTIVKAGDNVTVTSTSDATTGQKTYTVSTTSPVVYTDKDGNKVYLHDDGKFYTSATGGTEVNNSNVIASFKDPSGATTGGTMIVNNVGSAISNHTTPGVTSPTYLDKLDAAAGDTKTQNAAVNVTDLKNTADGLTEKGLKFDANSGGVKTNKLGSTVKVQGEGAKADTEYSGKNVKTIINQDSVGNTTIDVKLDKNLETDTITATGKDGKDGKIGINGADGQTTTITVTRDGKPGVDGAPGTTTTRIVYEKTPGGGKEEVATLNDGMKYAGDDAQGTDKTKVVKKKLNETLDIIGGADATKLTDGNIGVNNDGNGKLKVQLSKNLKDIDTIKNGGTTITLNTTPGGASNTPAVVINGGNLSMGGNKITNVAPGEISSTSTEAVNGSQLYKLKAEERHIRPTNVPTGSTETTQTTGTDAVYKYDATTKKVTLVYNDGNGTAVNDTKAVIDFSDLSTGGSGTNTTVESTDGTVKVTDNGTSPDHKYDLAVNSQKVVNNAQLPVTYTKADGTKVYLHNDGNFYDDKAEGQGNLVAKSDVIASMNDGNNSTTAPMRLNNVASSISNQTGATFLDKLDAANTNNPNSAVNVSDLKNTADGLTDKGLKFDANSGGVKTNKLGSTVKVQGAGTKADTNYDGSNIKTFIDQDASGNTTIDVKLDKDLKTETITAAGKDGKDGKIGINGHDGVTTTITVTRDGKPGLDGAPGTTTTRVVYEKPDGSKEEVATLNDGLRFTGNNTSTENKHKLNSLVKVKGEGVTEAEANAFDSAAGNIAVVADGTDTLTIKLNKNVKGLNTVETKTIQLGDPAGNHTTINYAGDRITYTTPDTTPGATPGSTVTHKVANLEDELHIKPGTYTPNAAGKVTLTYVDGNGNDVAGKTAVVDLSSFTPASGMSKWVAKSSAGEGTHSGDTTQDITDSKAVEFQAGKNVTITQTNDGAGNTVIKYGLSDEIEVGKEGAPGAPGKDGKVGVKGADGSAVVINGKDGSIGLNGTNGRDGITIQGKDGAKGLDGTNTTRIVYHDETNNKDHEVATLDDGMKFAGDDGQTDSSKVISKKLNTVVDIVGGADKTKLTDNNIGVNNVNGKLKVQLSKDLDLTAGGSVKMGDTTVNNGGITIKAPTSGTTTDVHLGSDGLNNGGNKITNVAKGTADTDAVNVSQLKDAKSELKADERHIKPGTYTVDSNGKVTMTYVDGNGDDVANEKAVIEGIAKNDLSNITNDGKNVITNLIDMENGNNTTVSSRKDATGKKIFKVDVDLSATNRKVDTAATGTGSVASGSAAGAAVVNKGTQFVAGDNMVVKRETMSGNDTDQKITYALNPNLQNIKSISSGTTTSNAPRIDFGSNTVTINNGNLSLGGNKITNLAPGTSSTDAVNLSQLEGARTKVTSNDGSVTVTRNENTTTKEITYDLHVAGGNGTPDPTIYNRLNNLGDEIQTVGALGAALGALKPIQYDPLEPTQIMAGYGNYRGTSALALGVAHYRNESLMMHAGMSWAGGSSHMMANAGVTWKLGHRDPETAIADRYRRGPISSAYALQQEMAAVKEENQGLKGEVADLKSENAEMKKNIAMLMAKLGM